MKFTLITAPIAALACLLASSTVAQTNVNWTGGAGNWSNRAAWFNESLAQTGQLPSVDFSEIARIDAGGLVTVDTALANGTDQGASTNPGQVRLGSVSGTGELVIASSGTLRVQAGESVAGGLEIGGSGTGAVRVLPGASLTVDGALASAAGAANLVQLGAATGAGAASIAVGSATLGGATVVHRNAAFTSSSAIALQTSSLYQPVFSGGVGATLQASGLVSLAGTLRPDFAGVAPAVGNSWKLLEGSSVSGSFASVDTSLVGPLGAGQAFVVTTADVAGDRRAVQLSLRQMAVLNVNRDTGVVSLSNPGTTPIALDGYTVASNAGSLGPSGWTSLQDQGALGGAWRESPASVNRVSELKRTGLGALAAGQSISLGTLYSPTPTMIGALVEDLALQFTAPDGDFEGLVTYSGTKVNNILLQVDPSSGAAQLRNTSNFTVQVDGYTISSVAGSLTPGTWQSLDEQNAAGGDWRESPGTANRLSEIKRAASTTLAPGTAFNLGTIFSPSLAKDLVFQYLPFGESQPRDGQVLFSSLSVEVPGDFNGDGFVNATDLAAWRASFGITPNADADNDGDSDGADFLAWQRNIGVASSAAGAASAVAAPEPGGASAALLLCTCLFARGCWRPAHRSWTQRTSCTA